MEPARALRALSEIGHTIVAGRNYEHVLDQVITAVGQIMNVKSGGFVLFEEETRELVLQKPAFGVSDEMVEAYRIPLHRGGVAVSVFTTGVPFFTNRPYDDDRLLLEYARFFDTDSLLTVPLAIEGRRIGVFHLLNRLDGEFTDDDVGLMTLLAPQLSTIIHSARMFAELQEREHQLQRTMDAHRSLTAAMLSGRGLAAVTAGLSRLIDRPVVIVNGSDEIISAHDADDAQRRLLVESAARFNAADGERFMDRVESGSIALRLEGNAGEPATVVVPVAIGTGDAAYVATIDEPRLDDIAFRAVEQFSMLSLIEIMHEAELRSLERRLHADILDGLSRAKTPREAAELMKRLGFDSPPPYRVAHVRVDPDERSAVRPTSVSTLHGRLYRALRHALAEHYPASSVVMRDQGFLLMVPAQVPSDPEAETDQLRSALRSILKPAGGYSVCVGVGPNFEQATDLRRAYEEAERVTAVAAQLGLTGRPLLAQDLGVYGLVVAPAGSTAELEAYVRRVLGPLLDYDAERAADWLPFLEALIDSNFSVKAAAARAHVHINTAKYRARRIEEMLGCDLSNADDRFALGMASRILSVSRALHVLEPAE